MVVDLLTAVENCSGLFVVDVLNDRKKNCSGLSVVDVLNDRENCSGLSVVYVLNDIENVVVLNGCPLSMYKPP